MFAEKTNTVDIDIRWKILNFIIKSKNRNAAYKYMLSSDSYKLAC